MTISGENDMKNANFYEEHCSDLKENFVNGLVSKSKELYTKEEFENKYGCSFESFAENEWWKLVQYDKTEDELREYRKYCERYDYEDAVEDDICEHIREHYEKDEFLDMAEYSRDDLEEELNDSCWTDDSVTGNASGSYTFNAWKAELYICHNMELLGDALREFGCSSDYLSENGAEACDVTIRCYLLSQLIPTAIDRMVDEFSEENEE